MNKKTFLIILILNLVAIYFYLAPQGNLVLAPKDATNFNLAELEQVKTKYPDLKIVIDSVIKANDAIGKGDGKDENKPEYQYGALGFAWKSFADYAESYKLANYKDYYQNSLAAYEKGIELSKRKNNLFLENAAKMAIHSDDYVKAEDYFKETLSLTAGDIVIYGELADLYEYNMHKSKAEVIAVYDKGISKALDAGKLTKRKAEYLKRVEGK